MGSSEGKVWLFGYHPKDFMARDSKKFRENWLAIGYIVTVDRDLSIDQTDESEVGRDPMKLPHTVFIYDYEGGFAKNSQSGFQFYVLLQIL